MAANNAIGTGAVVLTANADSLLAGLDKAEKATEKWAKSTGKTADANRKAYDALIAKGQKLAAYMEDVDYTKPMGGGGGGAKGGAVGGFLFGAGVGVALAGISAVIAGVNRIIDGITGVGEKVKEYGNIDVARRLRIDRAAKGFDRITAAADDFLFRAAEKLAPVIERVAGALEVVSHVGAAAFDSLVDGVGEVVAEIVQWVDEVTGAGIGTMKASELAFAALRLVGKGFAYIVDAAKWSAGQSLKAFAAITNGAGDLLDALGFEETAAKAHNLGASLAEVGTKWADSFGESAAKVSEWFDRTQKQFEESQRIRKFNGPVLSGAAMANSNEAVGIISRYQAGNIVTGMIPADDPVKIQKEHLKEAKEQKKLIKKLVDRRAVPLEIIP